MENVFTSVVHCNQTAQVKNRYIGESIHLITYCNTGKKTLERGTHHDDPLSAFLFIFYLKTSLIQIRDNESIKGININTYPIKLSAYADDADFFASDAMSLGLVLQTCAAFETFSSLKLEVRKYEACWIGACRKE